jgi:hypothetical protein
MAHITVKLEGHDPQHIPDVGQFVLITIPQDMKPEGTQLMANTNPKAMAEMALFLLRIAKAQMKGEDIRDIKLGNHPNSSADAKRNRILLPPKLRNVRH